MTTTVARQLGHADGAESSRDFSNPTDSAFMRCIDRLEALIEMETRILKSGERIDFDALNSRKTHALLELVQASRNAPAHGDLAQRRRIERLRNALADNARVIELHLQAMQEIAAIIVDSIREEASDGTYSPQRQGRKGK